MTPSFGFGDRLGLATPGHIAALEEAGGPIRGVFAQQSIREMRRTGRSAEDVMQSAVDAIGASNYHQFWSADADHLKTVDDIRQTMAAGFVFFTLDPSDDVDQLADGYDDQTLSAKFAAIRHESKWTSQYEGRTIAVAGHKIQFDAATLARAAVKYGRALQRAIQLAKCVEAEASAQERPFELELSVDETAQPTTAAEHYLIVDQLRQAGVRLTSLAPRFVGEFEKGVDYKGDLRELERSMRLHAEIAQLLGPYKLSLHSGSDKLSVYPLLARATGGMFHVKTAGTSYLEALRVVAHYDADLFHEIVTFSRNRYAEDKATYHVSARLEDLPESKDVGDVMELERLYLERWEDVPAGRGFVAAGRQILHCTFGSVVSDARIGQHLMSLLSDRSEEFTEILRVHFAKHLEALNAA